MLTIMYPLQSLLHLVRLQRLIPKQMQFCLQFELGEPTQ